VPLRLRPWPQRPPEEDPKAVGITFVDVLFALVIARVLEPFAGATSVTGPGVMHLVLAGVLTLTSWIGYHNSLNRPQYFIRFPNLPLFQFLIDVALVVVYWLTAVAVEQPGETPSPTSESILVAISFGLYSLWDFVGYRIRRDVRYYKRPLERHVPARRGVTLWCFLVSTVVAVFVIVGWPSGATAVYVVDAILVGLLVAYRVLKEYVTQDDPFANRRRRISLNAALRSSPRNGDQR
jgi:hypothetical protein